MVNNEVKGDSDGEERDHAIRHTKNHYHEVLWAPGDDDERAVRSTRFAQNDPGSLFWRGQAGATDAMWI